MRSKWESSYRAFRATLKWGPLEVWMWLDFLKESLCLLC